MNATFLALLGGTTAWSQRCRGGCLPWYTECVLDGDGIFRVLEGAYGDNPIIPSPPEGTMSLATINLPPYPCLSPHRAKQVGRPDYGATVKQISNKRFTMRDIGTLETRIKNLEYYASLNLLENFAKDQTIVNSGGTDRFKNGILVDGFTGHNVGSVLDPDYKISIDPKKKEARPFFVLENKPTYIGDASGIENV